MNLMQEITIGCYITHIVEEDGTYYIELSDMSYYRRRPSLRLAKRVRLNVLN